MFTKEAKRFFLMGLSLVMMVVLAACGSADTPEVAENTETESDRVLVVAHGADAVSLDPQFVNDGFSAIVNTQIYETLVSRDSDMNIIPALAKEWTQIDELTYEFKLREDVYFHNGEHFTAADVEFTLLRALDSAIASPILGDIDPNGIEVIDDYTIRISTKQPFAPILASLGHSTAFIVNEKAVTEFGEAYNQNPVGTGPFKFENWNRGSSVALVRNDDFHGEIPQISGIEFRVIAEASNRLIELETGAIDMAFGVGPSDVTRIENDESMTLLRRINLATSYIGINTQKEPFTDVRVRQAMNYAVNNQLIVDTILEGVGAPATGPMGSNIPGAADDLEGYEYNLERARELLAEAGFEDGFSTTIWVDNDTTRIDTVTAVANQLRQVGINVEIQTFEWAAFLEHLNTGEHDMFMMGWTAVTGDPDYALFPLFHSSQFGSAGNRTFFDNADVDRLLELARSTSDEAERAAYYRELQQLITEQAPWIFLNVGEALVATRSDVHGYIPRLNGQQRLDGVYFE